MNIIRQFKTMYPDKLALEYSLDSNDPGEEIKSKCFNSNIAEFADKPISQIRLILEKRFESVADAPKVLTDYILELTPTSIVMYPDYDKQYKAWLVLDGNRVGQKLLLSGNDSSDVKKPMNEHPVLTWLRTIGDISCTFLPPSGGFFVGEPASSTDPDLVWGDLREWEWSIPFYATGGSEYVLISKGGAIGIWSYGETVHKIASSIEMFLDMFVRYEKSGTGQSGEWWW